jgi:hypothetical protein
MVTRKRQNGTSAIMVKYESDPASMSPPSLKKSAKLLRIIFRYLIMPVALYIP